MSFTNDEKLSIIGWKKCDTLPFPVSSLGIEQKLTLVGLPIVDLVPSPLLPAHKRIIFEVDDGRFNFRL